MLGNLLPPLWACLPVPGKDIHSTLFLPPSQTSGGRLRAKPPRSCSGQIPPWVRVWLNSMKPESQHGHQQQQPHVTTQRCAVSIFLSAPHSYPPSAKTLPN